MLELIIKNTAYSADMFTNHENIVARVAIDFNQKKNSFEATFLVPDTDIKTWLCQRLNALSRLQFMKDGKGYGMLISESKENGAILLKTNKAEGIIDSLSSFKKYPAVEQSVETALNQFKKAFLIETAQSVDISLRLETTT